MFKQRMLTAIVLGPLAVFAILFLPSQGLYLAAGACLLIAAWEWANMSGIKCQSKRCAYALFLLAVAIFVEKKLPIDWVLKLAGFWWFIALLLVTSYPKSPSICKTVFGRMFQGFLVLVPTWVSLLFLFNHPHGRLFILVCFSFIWGADIGAYLVGKRLGQHKIVPKLSPGKSWEGFVGGLLTVACIAFFVGFFSHLNSTEWFELLLISWLVMIASVVGDLLESSLKRQSGLKDSGNLLPGHGGVMDRIDGVTAAMPIFALFLLVMGL